MAPRVFVVNKAGHDYTPAEKFGEIKWIIEGYVSLQSLDRVIYDVSEALKETTPDDYCCVSGTAFLNAITAALWFQKHGLVKFLVFDFKRQEYRVTKITSWHGRTQSEDGLTSTEQVSSGSRANTQEPRLPES